MENNLQKSPKLGSPANSSDAKYVSGLGTILVATIQEAKERISQIEYIFCSQLFPNFQLNPQILKKIYTEARQAADDEYRQKEKDLLHQINKLNSEKQQFMEENQLLKQEKEKFMNMESQFYNRINELQREFKQRTMEQQNLQKVLESKASLLESYEKTTKDLEEKNTLLLKKQKRLEVEIEELGLVIVKKSKEVDDVMELQRKLIQTNGSKACLVLQKEVQLKEYEEKTSGLISKLEKMENKVNELQSKLRDRTEEVDKGKKLQENLLKKIEIQSLEIMQNEQLLNKYEKEDMLLSARVESLVKHSDELKKKLGRKTSEIEEVRKVQEQLFQQRVSFDSERNKKELKLEEFDKLLNIQRGLEEKVDKLQQCLHERAKESSEGMELHGKLLQQIEVKDSELLSEKRKRKDVFDAYKKLKSQYIDLLKKYAITQEFVPPHDKMENESEIIRHDQTPVILDDTKDNASKGSSAANEVIKPEIKQKISKDKKEVVLIKKTSPISPPTSSVLIAPKCPTSMKSWPPAGAKRPISYWRDTRSHQSRVGPDPHDDFLDTPLENVRGKNSGKVMKEDIPNFPKLDIIKTSLNNSDDETQDMNVDIGHVKRHVSPPRVGTSGFKYVEPVRKKAERENLKGVECKQCKKFYDAVLLPDEGKDSNGNKQNGRCEHHDGVSRHRYRYAPPLTPEGFWNIGFESEM